LNRTNLLDLSVRERYAAISLNLGRTLAMTIADLIFVGFNGYAMALDRETGEVVWCNNQLKSGYVTLLLDGDRLIVSTNGYMFCLDPLTGETLWNNPLKGYGVGPASIVSVRGQMSQPTLQQAAAVEATRQANTAHAGS
jgi:hypothetical protein